MTENNCVTRGESIASIPGQHDGDCVLWWVNRVPPVQSFQTARVFGLVGTVAATGLTG
jgi:hypothetical protein